jgi:hypothetical protein
MNMDEAKNKRKQARKKKVIRWGAPQSFYSKSANAHQHNQIYCHQSHQSALIHPSFLSIRVNLTLNRDKDEFDESPDELPEELEPRKMSSQSQPSKPLSKAKALATRSRSVLGCDQVGIETLVSMLSSGGSDSEKEEPQPAQPPAIKADTSRARTNMLRKTGEKIIWK